MARAAQHAPALPPARTRHSPSSVPRTVFSGIRSAYEPASLVGRLTVTQQLLTTAQAPGQTLVICSAPRHSPSAEALSLLARTVQG